MKMPVIKQAVENANLQGRDLELARMCIGRGGCLRATKPNDKIAAYVWRMLAFYISPKPEHHCMPVTADLGIPKEAFEHYDEKYNFKKCKRFIEEELDPIVNAIVDQVPKTEWHGVRRWARALS